jgi:hypothetical protein
MNKAVVKRPEILPFDDESVGIEMSMPRDAFDDAGNLVDILIAPTIVLPDKLNDEGRFDLPIDPKMFDGDVYNQFNQATYSIGKLTRLAELNLDNLSNVIGLYLSMYPLDDILQRNADCGRLAQYDIANKFNSLTFGSLRNILSCIVKSDVQLHVLDELNDSVKRNNFTSMYNNYIEDRDRYTHGILFFRYPEGDHLLRVKNGQGRPQYITYNEEIFVDNLKTHQYLNGILDAIRSFLQGALEPQGFD